ncbi:glutamine--fructose-6-phosphate transaminase (isomerizing) [Anaerotignum lactatifermentans]|uniref:Glutamine--fructose-6-phosphate aminotransferase [isomerizing] n=1 Tax=Anaerotignum lactatifermentans TaxID=160404 RepID=A0ABS2G5L2_9FIRM|nr:glutamine--fructose-6-phosphate transaminase (isomerizing) [Anaerotignum lactatifermentans]MBM6828111.1 glutamine--fructose-6-phosphate transaminase (isomerizing) [Anaerotignum lactatifermentans]MBM6876726.1 glutamine--fructose-6-phosphate transaminase (isomerizing) [Anaerotignum lactatifermentans]MBM6949694.1 glutamine--fructose-6-phosphate transaminase (isomerizing) [Anaerotignum lactatifermentans]
MCGIVGYIGKAQAAPILIKGLSKLEYRGYDSAGIAVFGDQVQVVKAKGRLAELDEKVKNMGGVKGCMGIGHTRWATHGAPSDKNAHPHTSMNGRISVVHNGIIENYIQLKSELEKQGYVFVSETDTEVIAQLFDSLYNGDLVDTLIRVIGKVRGSYALGIVCSEKPDEFVAVRKDSPLLVGISEDGNYIASDIPAVLEYTKDYYLLNDNEIVVMKKDGVTILDLDKNEIKKDIYHVDWDISAAEKGGYDYFMMKEIMEQPKALKATISPRLDNGQIVLDQLKYTDEDIKNINRIHIVACGSAWHAGIVGKYVIEDLARIPVEVDLASEFRYRNPILNKNDVCIIISQSGETADTLAALREAKRQGIRILSIVNVVGSSIARDSDDVLYTWAGPEIAVATTKGYSTQVALMYLIALKFGQVRGCVSAEEAAKLVAELESVPEKIEQLFALDGKMKELAEGHANAKDVFIIGRGIDYAVALECSLKLKEISYIHSEAYAAGELKHGTISLIEEGTLVVAIATQDTLYEKLVSNVKEVKARGANVLAIAKEGNTEIAEVADEVIYIPAIDDRFTASLDVIPMQLFAYYVAVARGCDVDKPRNLAKSVTVE